MIVISGQSQTSLAAQLAEYCRAQVGTAQLSYFPNGEKRVFIETNLTNQNVVILQSFTQPVDENIIELLLLVDAADRAGAKDITVVIPWMGYSLQDKQFVAGQPLSARVIADLISSQRINRVYLLDLHNLSIAGFFSVPTRIISSLPLLAQHVTDNLSQPVVVSPDFGGMKRAREFAGLLNAPLAHIEKTRHGVTGEVAVHSISGADVMGQDCVVIDDIISTGGTMVAVAELLQQKGARSIHLYATHGLFVQNGFEKLEKSPLTSITITDSVPHPEISSSKLLVLSMAQTLGDELLSLFPH